MAARCLAVLLAVGDEEAAEELATIAVPAADLPVGFAPKKKQKVSPIAEKPATPTKFAQDAAKLGFLSPRKPQIAAAKTPASPMKPCVLQAKRTIDDIGALEDDVH